MKIKSIINIWVLLFAGIIAVSLVVFLLFVGWNMPPENEAASPIMINITKINLTTITPLTLSNEMMQATEEPDSVDGSGEIMIGSVVQIHNTEGAGLRLRSEASISGRIQFLGEEQELFEVRDGPSESDGYIWWYLESPYDETRSGWAASDYLMIISEIEK